MSPQPARAHAALSRLIGNTAFLRLSHAGGRPPPSEEACCSPQETRKPTPRGSHSGAPTGESRLHDRFGIGAVFPVLVVLMGVVFASACGDDASEPTPVPSAEQPRTAAPEQSPPEITPLKIAFLADFSG